MCCRIDMHDVTRMHFWRRRTDYPAPDLTFLAKGCHSFLCPGHQSCRHILCRIHFHRVNCAPHQPGTSRHPTISALSNCFLVPSLGARKSGALRDQNCACHTCKSRCRHTTHPEVVTPCHRTLRPILHAATISIQPGTFCTAVFQSWLVHASLQVVVPVRLHVHRKYHSVDCNDCR